MICSKKEEELNAYYLGKALRAIRESEQVSQQVVADKLGISQAQWSRYESGESLISFEKVIKFLNITFSNFETLQRKFYNNKQGK